MKRIRDKLAEIVEALPPEKAQALLEFARYLAEMADHEEWDRLVSDPRYERKLRDMAEQARAEFRNGKTSKLSLENPDP